MKRCGCFGQSGLQASTYFSDGYERCDICGWPVRHPRMRACPGDDEICHACGKVCKQAALYSVAMPLHVVGALAVLCGAILARGTAEAIILVVVGAAACIIGGAVAFAINGNMWRGRPSIVRMIPRLPPPRPKTPRQPMGQLDSQYYSPDRPTMEEWVAGRWDFSEQRTGFPDHINRDGTGVWRKR